ncbi:MAG TPA: Nif3-like dinuclear metal center hexameric protein [Prolixibacteraceae bacterium]|nr:Nif3-like dinuclear metal center hexameric protein [Prolixibacteraceae bacterium]
MKINDIIGCIEEAAPLMLQESWDNSGLLTGNPNSEIESALITLDVTEAVVDEAIHFGNKLIISHHPLIFNGIRKLTGKTDAERALIKAIKHDIALYAAHTNIDSVQNGVSWKMAHKLGLNDVRTLTPQKGLLKKLVTFVPSEYAPKVREAICAAGAGHIGNYDYCTFNGSGEGTFRGNEKSAPFVGVAQSIHVEKEIRIETIFPAYQQKAILKALTGSHPYEEVAYDIYPLDNVHPSIGLGVVGTLASPETTPDYLKKVKNTFGCEVIRWAGPAHKTIQTVALCGGSGSTLLPAAIGQKADLFITADYKYHPFFDAGNDIVIADIGHYESEQFTKELFYEILTNKFSKFALRLSAIRTNPVNYLF